MSLSYDYYAAVLYAIDQVAKGYSLTRACDLANISVSTFKNYINRDETLKDLLADAEQRGYDAMADALLEIDTHEIYGSTDPRMAGLISSNIKWVLEKRDSQRFGAKLDVNHNVTLDKAIVNALEAAAGRSDAALPPPPESKIVDITPVVKADLPGDTMTEEEMAREILS